MKGRRLVGIVLAIALLTGAHAQEILKKDMRFSSARAALLRHGWQPLRMHAASVAASEREVLEKTLIRHGIVEVDSCSVDAGSLCNFFYKRDDSCMRVMTRGEQLKDLRVRYWETLSACPVA